MLFCIVNFFKAVLKSKSGLGLIQGQQEVSKSIYQISVHFILLDKLLANAEYLHVAAS